jgi:hypothetical protein
MNVLALPIVLFVFLLPLVGVALVVVAALKGPPQLAARCVRT